MASSVRIIPGTPGHSCRPTTRPDWSTSSRSQSIPGLPTRSTPAPGICLISRLMAGRAGKASRTESLTIPTFLRSISIRAILITSSRRPAVEFMKRQNGGDSWTKVQGIPSQSRRTRAIVQHPSIAGLVFAGTTEGFWRSDRGGKADSWMVTTSRQLEINSIAIHPSRPQTIYIGTNNYGVMVSTDGGKNFVPTNGGYSGRFANVIVADRETPNRHLCGDNKHNDRWRISFCQHRQRRNVAAVYAQHAAASDHLFDSAGRSRRQHDLSWH